MHSTFVNSPTVSKRKSIGDLSKKPWIRYAKYIHTK